MVALATLAPSFVIDSNINVNSIQLFGPWICATIEISFAQQAQLPTTDL